MTVIKARPKTRLSPPDINPVIMAEVANPFTRKINGYETLSGHEIALLDQALRPARTIAARYDLVREGDKPGPVVVMIEGWACRYKILPDGSRQILAFLMPGDFCDLHAAVLNEMDHTIATVTPCRIATIVRERMERLIVATPALTQAFWRAQLIDESIMRAWIASIGRRESMERFAHLMLELHVRMRNIGLASDGFCDMPLVQIILADAIGLTPVHVNRVLRTLRERRIMDLDTRKLSIVDIDELARIAGFDDNYLHRRIRVAA